MGTLSLRSHPTTSQTILSSLGAELGRDSHVFSSHATLVTNDDRAVNSVHTDMHTQEKVANSSYFNVFGDFRLDYRRSIDLSQGDAYLDVQVPLQFA
jgi:hypothetical protein